MTAHNGKKGEEGARLEKQRIQLEEKINRLHQSQEKTRKLLAEVSAKRPRQRNARVIIHKNKEKLQFLAFEEKQELQQALQELNGIQGQQRNLDQEEKKYQKIRIGAGVLLGLVVIITLFAFFFSGSDLSLTGLLVGNVTEEGTQNDSVNVTGEDGLGTVENVSAEMMGVNITDGENTFLIEKLPDAVPESVIDTAAVVEGETEEEVSVPQEKIPKELKENLDLVKIPEKPAPILKKPKTVDDIIRETGMRVERSKVKEIKQLGPSSEEVMFQDWKYHRGLIVHKPLVDGKKVTEAIPLQEKDEFTYAASFEGTTLEIEFDTPDIKRNKKSFSKFKSDSDTAWKFGYNYKLPSETFTARVRVSSSDPIEITDTYFAAMKSGQLELDFETERRNNYDVDTVQAAPNIVYVYLTKNFTEEGKNIGDGIVLDPTLTISNTRTELCGTVSSYDLIDVNTGGVLQLCEANSTSNYGWVNISVGYFGNFSLDTTSKIEGFSNGRSSSGGTGGPGDTATNAAATQGQNGNNGTAGSADFNPNGGGGGGGDKAGNNDAAAGAGGAFGGNGGRGGLSANGTQAKGGVAYGAFNSVVLKMGSGGGGASSDNASQGGGDGGGGIKIVAGAQGWIGIRGAINVTGSNGTDAIAGVGDLAGGGGGSGGHVVLIGGTMNLNSAVVQANAGGGGRGTGTDSCPGGGGGGGRIYVIYETLQANGTRFTTNHGFLGGNITSDAACINPSNAGGSDNGQNGTFQMNGSVFFNRMPRVVALAPANLTVNSTDATPEFFFNVTDDLYLQSYLNCTLQVQNATGTFNKGTNNTVFNNTLSIITADSSLNDGSYSWWINCSDGINPWGLGNGATPEYFDANISVFRNLTMDAGVDPDITPPNVTNITPVANSFFNITNLIEIGANVTDGTAISLVFANVSYPNGSIILFNLSNNADRPNWYNMSFRIPELTGKYNITFIANDTVNNYNRTETTYFGVNVSCANLTRTTTMDQQATSIGTCFYIGAPNVVLDCAGYTINYGMTTAGYGVNNSDGYSNLTVQDCRIIKGSTIGDNNTAIYISDVLNALPTNMTIINNTLITNGTGDNYGIFFQNVVKSRIINNTIVTDGSESRNIGIWLNSDASNNTVDNNNISTNGKGTLGVNYGIDINTRSHNNTITLNNIRTNGTGTGTGSDNYGIQIVSSSNSTFIFGNDIKTNGSGDNYGISIALSSYSTTIYSNTISAEGYGTDGADNDGISISRSFNTTVRNNTIYTNGTTSNDGISFSSGSNGSMIDNNIITVQGRSTSNPIEIVENSNSNWFINNNLTVENNVSPTAIEIYDENPDNLYVNYIVYNNTWGEIKWLDNGTGSFLRNLTLDVTNGLGIGLDRNLFIGNNTIAVNTSAFSAQGRGRINGTVNMTLIGINNSYVTEIALLHNYNLSINFSLVQSGGVKCLTCSNISYLGNTLKFNATGLGVFSANDSTPPPPPAASDCGMIMSSTTLINSVTAGGNCFGIGASNVVLDCAGYTVTYGTSADGIGINSTNTTGATIRNCIVTKGSVSGANNWGIYLTQTNHSIILNNSITTNGTNNNYGIYILASQNDTVWNTSIKTDGSSSNNYGILLTSALNNTLIGNTIRTTGTGSDYGIYFSSGSNNSYTESNVVAASGVSVPNYGILLDAESNNNQLANNNITSNTSQDAVIRDDTNADIFNYLIYNNTWGEIRWIDNGSSNSFVRNLTLNITNNLGIGLDRNIFISNNTIAVNTSAFGIGLGRINGTVNMTLIGINLTYVTEIAMIHNYNLSINFSIVQSGGVKCLTCSNISYLGNTLKFNATGLGVFSANDSTAATVASDSCGTLTTSKTLVASVSSTGTCFNISAANIFLDCNGYTITYGTAQTGYGVNNSDGYSNLTVEDCRIIKGSAIGDNNTAIYISDVVNSLPTNMTIIRNTLITNGTGDNYGIFFQNVVKSRIINNTIVTDGSADKNVGIWLNSDASNNTVDNNNISTNGKGTLGVNSGIDILTRSHNNSITLNNIRTNGTGSGTGSDNYGIRIQSSSNYTFIFGNDIKTNGSGDNYGINVNTNNYFTMIYSNTISADGYGVDGADNDGINLIGSHNTTIRNNTIYSNGTSSNDGITLVGGANGSVIDNNIITVQGKSGANAIDIGENSASNWLINNNLTVENNVSATAIEIYDENPESLYVNYFVYNSTWGEIRWLDNGTGSFLRNLTLDVTNGLGIGLDRNLFIRNNTIAVNTSAFSAQGRGRINGTVNMTLIGINNSYVTEIALLHNYNLSINFSMVQSGGVKCLTCSNISYLGNTLKFNATGLGVFSANDSTAAAGGANSRPTAPVTSLPTNGSSPTNRTGVFAWWNSTDADGDLISYELEIDDNARFNNPELNVSAIPSSNSNVSATYYFSTTLLAVDTTYYWRVRANDSTGFGEWSNNPTGAAGEGLNMSNFTLNSLLQISFINNAVEFGTLAQDQIENTSDQNPLPFRGENTGNIYFNVTVNGSEYFTSVAHPSSYYNFKIRENESGSFNLSQSQLQWVFMPKINSSVHVAELNWRDAFNDFLVDINVTVPNTESSGLKSSNVTFAITGSNLG